MNDRLPPLAEPARPRAPSKWRRRLHRLTTLAGTLSIAFCLWLLCDLPLVFDRLLIESDTPVHADAIVCIGAGLNSTNLPTDDGWRRIYTSVQLFADGFAPLLVTTGGGAQTVSEAEVYADAAAWLGVPKDRIVMEPYANSTAEQPAALLKTGRLATTASLDLVTTTLHSKRVALTFRKAGFTNVHVVTGWIARARNEPWHDRRSQFGPFRPSGKSYADTFNRTRWKLDYLMVALREAGALTWYRLSGKA